MNVLVRKNNQERGPYTEAELRERLKSGALSPGDLGQIEGESEWKPLSEILLASVLATDKPTATPSPGRDFIANYQWLRDPKVIGGAVVLLLLIFGGINWLNKASEKRKEEAIAARQAAAMQQAQKQAEEYSRQGQEQAAKARQAQLDQVKQMMAMSEKAQRDYQEKQKREQEERQKAEQTKIDAEQRKQQEGNKEAEKRRLAAEAKQKAQEAEFLKNQPKPAATVASKPNAPAASVPTITLVAMPVGPLPKEREKIVFSDDLARVFVIAAQGSRVQAIVDGVPGPLCRKLRWPWQEASLAPASYGSSLGRWSDNTPVAGPPPFSPDKKRVAYIAELDAGKEAVVIDSVQSPVYDKIGWMAFGPNGHHLAYIAITYKPGVERSWRNNIVTMVDNGKAGPTFDDIASASYKAELDKEAIVFSADGEHLAYIGQKNSNQRDHYRVVIDGRAEPREYEGIGDLRVSRNGQHIAYVASNYIPNNMGGGTYESKGVLDGKEGPGFPSFAGANLATEKLVLSEDGSRCAYVVKDRSSEQIRSGGMMTDQKALVDKGVKGPAFNEIEDIVVSANGQRLAYSGGRGQIVGSHQVIGHWVVIDNGKESVPYDNCGSLKVSPDGSLLSFFADSSQGKLLVVNGQEFGPFYNIHNDLTYSADGKHWACSVEASSSYGSGQFLADGETFPVPNEARGGCQLQYRADKGWIAKTAECELEIKAATPDAKPPARIFYTRDGKQVASVFASGRGSSSATERVTLDDKPVGQPYYRVQSLQLSDDGKHIAFIGASGAGGKVIFDGEEGAEHAEIHDLVMTPDGRHIAYSAEDRKPDAAWHVVVDGFEGPKFDYETNYKLASTKFNADGSLTFIASLKGQLARYTYPAEALKFMPMMSQTESVTAGLRPLQNLGSFSDVARDLVLGPNETLYGLMARGGQYGSGALFSCKTNGSDFKILHSFYGDKESGPNSLAGDRENVWGTAGSSVFRYNIKKGEYQVVTSQYLTDLRGILPDGSLLGEQSDGSSEYHWWMLSRDGASLEKTASRNAPVKIAAIGPDGAIYSTDSDSLYRQASFYSEPKLLHKFQDSPEEGKDVAPLVTFDPTGTVYGFAKGRTASIIYRVRPDASDFRVLVPQSRGLNVRSLASADDGMLYGCFSAELKTADSQTAGFFRIPAEGGDVTILPNVRSGTDHALIYNKRAIYYTTDSSIIRVQLPSASGAARLTPMVTIKSIAAPPLSSAEPVSFTTSAGEAIPTAKAPDGKAGAAIWQPPAPGTTTIATFSKQSPPRGQNRLTPSSGANLPSANFGNAASSGQGLNQQEAELFATTNVNAMSAGDINTLTSLYGNQVDYQDKGVISNDAVRNEFQQYFARWPQTNWQLAGTVAVQPVDASRCQITFPVSFDAMNPSSNKHATGVARETMILEQEVNGAWKIVMERQTVTSNKAENRGRRREREKVYEGKPIDRRPNLPIPPNIPWPPGLPRP
jgi:GYF domain 2